MTFYLHSIGNLGDFLNCMPVMSGVHNKYGKIDFIVTHKLKQFKGFRDFLMYQGIFNTVEYDDDTLPPHDCIIVNPWNARETKGNPNRPLETCRFENNLVDMYKLEFDVDDDFVIKYPDCDVHVSDLPYVADRWSSAVIDKRRATWVLESSGNFTNNSWLDYGNDILTNCYIIKKSVHPLYTTFTGVSVLADLLKKDMYVFWGDELLNWDNKTIDYSYKKHFYQDRFSKLVHLSNPLSIPHK